MKVKELLGMVDTCIGYDLKKILKEDDDVQGRFSVGHYTEYNTQFHSTTLLDFCGFVQNGSGINYVSTWFDNPGEGIGFNYNMEKQSSLPTSFESLYKAVKRDTNKLNNIKYLNPSDLTIGRMTDYIIIFKDYIVFENMWGLFVVYSPNTSANLLEEIKND